MSDSRKKKDPDILPQPVAEFDPTGQSYLLWLDSLKRMVRESQIRAALAVNREMILVYWRVGKQILEKQANLGWGAKVIDHLADALRSEFSEMKGWSTRNLKYMRAFAEAYPDESFVQEVPAQITWYHNTTLLDKVKNESERVWYARQAIQNGWSRNVLVHQIETRLLERQGQAITNFDVALPPPQSDLARELLKDPYNFDFLTLGKVAQERNLERNLLQHLRDFLLELGQGFAFVGSQYHLEVGGEDFYLDLLFYHLNLRCYVVIDLKMGPFKPEYAGKMNFYLSAVDEQLRHPSDPPSIGLILCKERNRLIVEYALRDTQKPMGVAAYRLLEELPDQFKRKLPTADDLELGLSMEGSNIE